MSRDLFDELGVAPPESSAQATQAKTSGRDLFAELNIDAVDKPVIQKVQEFVRPGLDSVSKAAGAVSDFVSGAVKQTKDDLTQPRSVMEGTDDVTPSERNQFISQISQNGISGIRKPTPSASSPALTEDYGFADASADLRKTRDAEESDAQIQGVMRRTGATPQTAANIVKSAGIADTVYQAGKQALIDGTGSVKQSTLDWDAREKYKDASIGARGLKKGVEGFKQQGAGLVSFFADTVPGDWSATSAAMDKVRDASDNTIHSIGDRGTDFEKNLEGAISSTLSNAPGLIGGVLTGTEAVPLFMMGAQTFGDEWGNGKKAGLSYSANLDRAAIFAAWEIVGEKFGMGDTLRGIKASLKGASPSAVIEHFAKAMAKELPGEQLTTAGEFGYDKFSENGLNKKATIDDYVKAVKDTFVQTLMQSGMMMGGGAVANAGVRKVLASSGGNEQIVRSMDDAVNETSFSPDSANAQSAPYLPPKPAGTLSRAAAIAALDPNGALAVDGRTVIPPSAQKATESRVSQAQGMPEEQSSHVDIPASDILGQVEPEVSGASDLISQDEIKPETVQLWQALMNGGTADNMGKPSAVMQAGSVLMKAGALNGIEDFNALASSIRTIDALGLPEDVRQVAIKGVVKKKLQEARNGASGQEVAQVAENSRGLTGDLATEGVPDALAVPATGLGDATGGTSSGSGADISAGAAIKGSDAVAPAAPSIAADIKKAKSRSAAQQANDRRLSERRKLNTDTDSISIAVRKLGGINKSADLAGEIRDLKFGPSFMGAVWKTNGKGIGIDQMARLLSGHGYVDESAVDGGVQEMLDKLREDHFGGPAMSVHQSADVHQAAYDAHMQEREEQAALERDGLGGLSESDVAEAAKAIDTQDDLDGLDLIDHSTPNKVYNNIQEELDDVFGPTSAQSAIAATPQGTTGRDVAGSAESHGADHRAQVGRSVQEIGQDASVANVDGFRLESQTESSTAARERQVAAAASEREAESKKADEAAKQAHIRQEIDSRQKSSAENFQLGQTADESLAGQGDIFSQPAASKSEAAQAKAHLDAAGVTGSERINTIAAVRQGHVTADEVAEAHGVDKSILPNQESAQDAKSVEADEHDATDKRIADAEKNGIVLSDDDKANIRAAIEKAAELQRKADGIMGRSSDPMNKGNAFPMGVGFTKMTKRLSQRIDSSVKRAGEAVAIFGKANQAEGYAEALLSGKGTEADKIHKAAKKEESRRGLVEKLLNWKKGDKIGPYTIERVNSDRDGYPASYTISGDGIIKGVWDKVDVAKDFFDGSKEAFRRVVDEVRDSAQSDAPIVGDGSKPEDHVPGVSDMMAPVQEAKSAPIEDFGEKISGARKEYAAAYKDRMAEAMKTDVLAQPLSKSWPEPNYQKLIDAGYDKTIVGLVRSMRDEIPNKPGKSYRQKTWAAQVELLRDTADKLLNDPEFADKFVGDMKKSEHLKLDDAINGRAELYALLGHEKSLKGIRITRGIYGVYEGIPYKPAKIIWEVTKDAKATAFFNMPKTLGSGDTRQDAIDAFSKTYSTLDTSKEKSAKTKFELYADRHAKAGDKGQYFIGKKVGRNVIHIKDGFDTVKEARAYISDHNEELTSILEQKKAIPHERYDINQPRVGQDMRNAQDVTPQMFSDAFGFRGVQFGNYVEGARRQKDLNDAYDALMDLAAVLDVPPKALSLNGELGLAFGARGTGGKHPASAHYEPEQIVINLTKGNGAGSLAHEWWHSLDNYFSRLRGKSDGYATDGLDVSLAARGADYNFKDEGIRKEMIDAFGAVVKAINGTAIRQRARSLDNRRTKEYWGTGIEMSARSFERYVIAKLHDNGFSNDYLSNVVSEEYWNAAEALGIGEGGSYPYPTESELPAIRAGFDKFFQTIETKETDQGTALYSRAWHGSPHDHDGFDMEHVGAGEGAQAYGHGLYFAGSKDVAEFYRKGLSYKRIVSEFRDQMPDDADFSDALEAAETMSHARSRVIRALAADDWLGFNYPAQAITAAFKDLNNYDASPELRDAVGAAQGRLYQVELAPSEDEYLDWDKPLSEQSDKVKSALSKGYQEQGMDYPDKSATPKTGREIYQDFRALAGGLESMDQQAASEYLHSIGIRGIRYLDGTSRSKAEGKPQHNYVIFDDKDVSITAKYSRAAKESLDDVLDAVNAKDNSPHKAHIGAASAWLVEKAKEAGLNIDGFEHEVDAFAARHIIKNHGDAAKEMSRGQLEVTKEDIRLIPDLLSAPDKVAFGTKNRIGRDQIVYLKKMADGSTLYLEEARSGNRELAAVTMRRYPATMNAADILATLDPNARSDGGNNLIIHDVPENTSAVDVASLRSRAGTESMGLPIARIQPIVDAVTAKLPRLAGVVHVVQTTAELPGGGLYSDIEGAYIGRTGEVYLVADNLPTESRLRKVLAHESIGHLAIEEMLGMVDPKLWDGLVRQIAVLEKGGNKLVNSLAKTVDERQPGLSQKNRVKEMLALMAEEDIQNNPLFVGAPRTTFQRFIDGIKAFMKLVFDVQMTDKDVLEIVKLAERHLSEKKGASSVVAGMKEAMASRAGITGGTGNGKPGNMLSRSSATPIADELRSTKLRKANKASMADDTSIMDHLLGAKFLFKAAAKLSDITGMTRLASDAYSGVLEKTGELMPQGLKDIGESVRAGMISDYGLDANYVDRKADMKAAEASQARKNAGLVEMLAGLTRAESRVAYTWMQEKPDTAIEKKLMEGLPAESLGTLRQLKQLISDLSKDAVKLGQLSPESFERNNMAYLHRTYAKHVLDNEGWLGQQLRSRSTRIKGNQYKGRGIFEEVGMEQIGTTDFWKRKTRNGKADASMKGDKLIRFERREASTEVMEPLPGMPAKPLGKLREVMYWPADEAIPDRFGDWVNAGEWEVRDAKGAKLVVWRDLTKAERERLGELDEVRYAVATTLQMAVHDIEVGKFFEWTAKQYGKSAPEGKEVAASNNLLHTYGKDEWAQVPTANIPGTQVKKYGALAGMYVPGPVWNDLRQTGAQQQGGIAKTYATVLAFWKKSKTSWSPGVHMNNVMANFVMADWHDIRAADLAEALSIWAKKDKPGYKDLFARFEDSGAMGGMFASNELMRDEIKSRLEELKTELMGEQDAESETGKMAKVLHLLALATVKPAKLYAEKMGAAYQHEDAFFRLAVFLKAVRYGKSDRDAGAMARHAFLNYDINAPWIQAARKSVLPFISFFYRALPMAVQTVKTKPWKVVKLMAFWSLVNALGALGGGDDDKEEKRHRKLMADEKSGRVWGLVPKMIRMPWNSDTGAPIYLDIRRWVPVGDVADMEMGAGMLPPWATPGGPMVILAELLMMNKSMFTEKELLQDTDTAREKAIKSLDHLFKGFMPNVPVPNPVGWALTTQAGQLQTYSWGGIEKAYTRKENQFGEVRSLPQAAANAVGIKVGSYPEEGLKASATFEAKKNINEITKNMQRAEREFNSLKHPEPSDVRRRDRMREEQFLKQRTLENRLAERLSQR